MTTTNATTTRIRNAEPYRGDDWAQYLARVMATPLFLMGAMIVAGALGTGIAGGVNVSDFFGGFSHPLDYLGRSQVLGQVTGALGFLGMGFILGGVVFSLVNIVRTLRDAGRDVQGSLGAPALKLRKPWSGHLTPHVMLMGLMAEIAAFVVGVVAAVKVGDIPPAALAHPTAASAHQLANIGFANAAGAWLPGLRFAGLATLLGSVVLVLTTIRKTLGFQAERVTEIAERATTGSQTGSAGPAPKVLDVGNGAPAAGTATRPKQAASTG